MSYDLSVSNPQLRNPGILKQLPWAGHEPQIDSVCRSGGDVFSSYAPALPKESYIRNASRN